MYIQKSSPPTKNPKPLRTPIRYQSQLNMRKDTSILTPRNQISTLKHMLRIRLKGFITLDQLDPSRMIVRRHHPGLRTTSHESMNPDSAGEVTPEILSIHHNLDNGARQTQLHNGPVDVARGARTGRLPCPFLDLGGGGSNRG